MVQNTSVRLSAKQKKQLIAAGRTKPWTKTIYGEPASKANSRKIVLIKGVPASIRSDKARAYAADFAKQCPILDPLFEGDILVELEIYYGSRRPDLDESIILDAMQGRIYRNDRQVRAKIVKGSVDADSPRTVIRISALQGGDGAIGS